MIDPRTDSPGDRVARCERWLAEHPEASLMDRAAFATVVAVGGDEHGRATFGDIARILDVPAADVLQGLLALHERKEAER